MATLCHADPHARTARQPGLRESRVRRRTAAPSTSAAARFRSSATPADCGSAPFNDPPIFFQHLGLYAYRRDDAARIRRAAAVVARSRPRSSSSSGMLQAGGDDPGRRRRSTPPAASTRRPTTPPSSPAHRKNAARRLNRRGSTRSSPRSLLKSRRDYAHPRTRFPLPLLITGVAGVAGYNALRLFPRPLPGPGHRHPPGRQLAAHRRRHHRLQRRRPSRACAHSSTNTNSAPCSTAPATARCAPASSTPASPGEPTSKASSTCSRSSSNATSASSTSRSTSSTPATERISAPRSPLPAPPLLRIRPHRPRHRLRQNDGRRRAAPPRLDAAGLHPPHLAADGRQLQRPRRRDRLDPIALQERPPGHALLRRNPHARLHRLPQPPLRARAGQRPRAASTTPAARAPCRSTKSRRSSTASAATTRTCSWAARASKPARSRPAPATSR